MTRDILVAGMSNSADTYVDHSRILVAEIRRDNEIIDLPRVRIRYIFLSFSTSVFELCAIHDSSNTIIL